MLKKFTAILWVSLTLPAFLHAQNYLTLKNDSLRTYHLSDIIITATRNSTPETEVASSVTVLTEKEIQNSNKNSLIDLLREVPGLSVARQGGQGTNASVFLRGANANHTLILVDGVTMNDPSSITNSFDFTNLQTDNIERIEILRGPQSTLYGSDAIAGVISILTKRGNGSPKINLLTEAGSYNTYRANAVLNGSNDFVNYSVSYSGLNSGGFSAANEKYGNSEHDGTRNNSFLTRFGLKLSSLFSLDVNYNFLKAKTDLDQNSKYGDDPNFTSRTEESVFRTALNAKLYNGIWQQTLSFSSLRHINHTIDDSDQVNSYSSVADFDGTRYKIEWQNNLYLNEDNTLSFGVDNSVEKAGTYFHSVSQWGIFDSYFPSIGTPEPKASTTGIFLQEQFAFAGSYFGTLGIRYDKHNKFGSEVTYRIAPAYFIKQTGTKIKATYGTGFKSPSLYNLFDPQFGNPDLKAERSKGWDAGIEQYLYSGKIVFGVTYFDNRFSNLLGTQNAKTVNIDSARTKGVELSVKASPADNFSVNFNYTYTDSRNTTTNKPESGLDLIRRPANKISLNANYTIDNLNLNIETLSIGKRYDLEFDPVTYASRRVVLAPYSLINLAATFEVNKYLTLLGRIDNLLNTEYEEVLFYGTPMRSAYIGIKLSY